MKKVIVILLIFSLIFISFFILKKEEEKENKNISVILETEEGNIESNTFPNKEDYEYLSTKCENIKDNINTTFNEETWKLNLNVEEEKVDGKFNCTVHFKEKKYNVEIKVENGTTDKENETVKKGENAVFNITPKTDYKDISVNCTNSHVGNINGSVLTVSNVTSDTVCTVACNKSKYVFDFTKAATLDDFNHIKGNGELQTNANGENGLSMGPGTYIEDEWYLNTIEFSFGRTISWEDFKVTIEYHVGNYDNSFGRFYVLIGNFKYAYEDYWGYTPTGANLYALIGSEYLLNYIKTQNNVGTFDGTVTIQKNDTFVTISGGYNQTTKLNESINLSADSLQISFMHPTGGFYSTVMRLRKVILEEI